MGAPGTPGLPCELLLALSENSVSFHLYPSLSPTPVRTPEAHRTVIVGGMCSEGSSRDGRGQTAGSRRAAGEGCFPEDRPWAAFPQVTRGACPTGCMMGSPTLDWQTSERRMILLLNTVLMLSGQWDKNHKHNP